MLPAATLASTSVFGNRAASDAGLGTPSLDAYAHVIGDPTFGRAVINTLVVAGLSAVLVTVVGGLIAWMVVRSSFAAVRSSS